jgi:predicted DNA repair protein MutK
MAAVGGALAVITPTALNALAGVIAGAVVLLVFTVATGFFGKKE